MRIENLFQKDILYYRKLATKSGIPNPTIIMLVKQNLETHIYNQLKRELKSQGIKLSQVTSIRARYIKSAGEILLKVESVNSSQPYSKTIYIRI